MSKLIAECPVCHGELKICALKCADCGLELRNDFKLSEFDLLSEDDYKFLICFLKNKGSLKSLQEEMGISYPYAKKKLDTLLVNLGLAEPDENIFTIPEEIEMNNLYFDENSVKASEIIKKKLKENGGRVTVYTLRGLPCEVWANRDGNSFSSNKLSPNLTFTYDLFDAVVDLLVSQNGHARKGNGRNYKFGEPECDETTVVGALAKAWGRKKGESVIDPVFVIASILDWADIARNTSGELVLTASYRSKLK